MQYTLSTSKNIISAFCFSIALLVSPVVVHAQDQNQAGDLQSQLAALNWYQEGQVGTIAEKATFKASPEYTFLNVSDTDKFLKINNNPPGGNAYTIARTDLSWFAILQFAPEGYVKDDETIDADALLKQLKKNNIKDAEWRRKEGYAVLTISGWAIPPRYDTVNKRLEWGTLLIEEGTNAKHVNVSTKILGRSGYTSVTLVTTPNEAEAHLADFKKSMNDFSYVSGEKYSEWKEGDKVAAYGLGALVLGGAAAVATSKGGFKAIGLGILAGLAALWAGIKRFFSRKK